MVGPVLQLARADNNSLGSQVDLGIFDVPGDCPQHRGDRG